jgi:hypothetical protein
VITVDPVDREAIYQELRRVRVTFRCLVEEASPDDLARASSGTRWTNQQLLFHMLFGYLITRALIVLAGMSARLPAGASRQFAGLLNAATSPFDEINYLGSRAGARIFPRRLLAARLDRVTWRWSGGSARRPAPGWPQGCTTRCDGIRFQGLHDPGRHLPLSDPAVRFPPAATHARSVKCKDTHESPPRNWWTIHDPQLRRSFQAEVNLRAPRSEAVWVAHE